MPKHRAESADSGAENKKFLTRKRLIALGLLAATAASGGYAALRDDGDAAPQAPTTQSTPAAPEKPSQAPELAQMDAEAQQFASEVLANVSEQVYSSPEEFNRTQETYDGVLVRSVTRSAESYADQTYTYSIEYADGTADSSPDNIAAVRLDVQSTDLTGNPQTDYYIAISTNGGHAQVTAQGEGWNAFGDFGGAPVEAQDSDNISSPDQLQSIFDQAEQIALLGADGGKLGDTARPY